MTILVVDDEPQYRLIMRSVLMAEGYDVLLAEHGEEALTKLKGTHVDLIVSDIYMPVMDGIKLHRTVRNAPETANIPVLFASAYDDQHTLDVVKNPRNEGFFKKGRPVEELIEWIRYLTTPEEKRPKLPPGGTKSRLQAKSRGF